MMRDNNGMKEALILAKRLQALRAKNHLSQHDLANKAGVSFRAIQEIETGDGNPTLQTIVSLAQSFKDKLVIFDIENYVDRDWYDDNVVAVNKMANEAIADQTSVREMNFSLQDKYIKALEELRDLKKTVYSQKPLPPLISEALSILSTLDEAELHRALAAIGAIKNVSIRNKHKNSKKTG